MKKIEIQRGEILQSKGDRHTKIYKVVEGLLRSYSIDEKGKEHIFMFASNDWIIADNTAPNEPAELYIDAIEKSSVIAWAKNIEGPHEAIKLIKRIEVLQKRIILLMSATAIERYEDFVATYPNIVPRVPQKMIASYLGITPEALSKVKKQRLIK